MPASLIHYNCLSEDGMKNCRQVENAIGKVASIVNSVRKSTVSSEILHDMDYNLRSANVTRWNSQLKMVRSVLKVPEVKLKEAVRGLLGPVTSRTLTTLERTLLKEYVEVMQPFKEATNCVQGEDRVTMSNVLPSIRGLRFKQESIHSVYCKQLITDLLLSINARLHKYETNVLYITGAVLDPRFKLHWCMRNEVEDCKNTVVVEMQKFCTVNVISLTRQSPSVLVLSPAPAQIPNQGSQEEPNNKKLKVNLFSFMESSGQQEQEIQEEDILLKLRHELNDYVKAPLQEYESDPLVWWNSNKDLFPHAARATSALLSIPA